MFLENTIDQWIAALIATTFTLIFLFALRSLLLRRLPFFVKTHPLFLIILSFYIGTLFLNLGLWPSRIALAAFVIQAGLWGNEVLLYFIKRSKAWETDEDSIRSGSFAVINFAGKIVLWSIVFIFFLSNLGFDVSALVTGLGIGGIAVALAVQNILGDLFASLSIVVDKPFKIGDLIVVDDLKGHVENIGLKTTRIRTISGEQAVFSNADLLKSRIRNYKRMVKRRVSFEVDVDTETPIEKLSKIPEMIKKIITPLDKVTFEHAFFTKIAENSFQYEIVYYIDNPDTNFYLKTQEEINLEILKAFQKEGIGLAPHVHSAVKRSK